jgi:UDP-N-acetylmuramate--alanine ligase
MRELSLPDKAKIHMVGIGGAGVSGLAVVMARMGYQVSGSDLKPGAIVEKLKADGVAVFTGHDAEYAVGADLVVASAAVPEDNPEIVWARKSGVPVISRAEMLGWLMAMKFGIAIAGTHGKTTTTSMVALVLETAGQDPTVLIGGDLDKLNGNAKLGLSRYLVAEACEAFRSFLELSPMMAVVTNIEADHLDCYGTLEGVIEGFRQFMARIRDGGIAILCVDCPNVRSVVSDVKQRVVTYGLSDDADCRGCDVDVSTPEPSFKVMCEGRELGKFELRVPGMHNVRNALAAIAVGCELGIDADTIRKALLEFRGAGRRFEVLGTAGGVTVVDDYAHHPTEIKAAIEAAKTRARRVLAVFQPHLYSRTHALAEGFAENLRLADVVILTEIYPAREKPIPGVTAGMISDLINADEPGKARFVPDKADVAGKVMRLLQPGDLVLVMGAGDIRPSGEEILALLREPPTRTST